MRSRASTETSPGFAAELIAKVSTERQIFATALALVTSRVRSALQMQEFRDTALNDAQPESTSPIDFSTSKMDFVMDRLDIYSSLF